MVLMKEYVPKTTGAMKTGKRNFHSDVKKNFTTAVKREKSFIG